MNFWSTGLITSLLSPDLNGPVRTVLLQGRSHDRSAYAPSMGLHRSTAGRRASGYKLQRVNVFGSLRLQRGYDATPIGLSWRVTCTRHCV